MREEEARARRRGAVGWGGGGGGGVGLQGSQEENYPFLNSCSLQIRADTHWLALEGGVGRAGGWAGGVGGGGGGRVRGGWGFS